MLYAITILILVLDRISKYAARMWLQGRQPVPVIPGLINLTYTENFGAAFGLLQRQRVLFVIVTFIVVVGVLYYARQLPARERIQRVALGLLMGGALGNLIDRIVHAYVVDFIQFPYWPVFNVADSALVIGVVLLVTYGLFELRSPDPDEGAKPFDAS